MQAVDWQYVLEYFEGNTVAIVGSGPGAIGNAAEIEKADIVVRVNNYKLSPEVGRRVDVHYSFYGNSIKKTRDQLMADGVKLCMCKCPDSKPIESEWHRKRHKMNGISFRYIYRLRKDFWFTKTYVPDDSQFLNLFEHLDRHIPTTGMAAILTISMTDARSIYLTGFDFFASKIHNIDEPWKPGDPTDPIGHDPKREIEIVRSLVANDGRFVVDKTIENILNA